MAGFAEFVNQTLRFYIGWYKPSEVGGYIPFSKNLIHITFDALTDAQMNKAIVDYIKHEFKEELSMLGREYTFSSVIDKVCAWADASRFPYRHDEKNNSTDTYAIRFNMGERWSHFF